MLGQVLLAAGEPARALGPLERAVALNPLNAGAYFSLGTAFFETGQLDAALESTRRAIVVDDGDARYHRQLAAILAGMGRDREARAALATAGSLEEREEGFR